MTYSRPARTTTRRIRSTVLAATVVLSATLIGFLSYRSLASPSSSASLSIDIPPSDQRGPAGAARPFSPFEERAPDRGSRSGVSVADGAVPEGVTVFDDDIPAVANLDPDLLGALRQAATDAEDDGVEFFVNSGWRSPEYQHQLLRAAVAEYGSEAEAARWVATAKTSRHVSGDAVDIGHSDATEWLSEYGSEYGLCQVYDNEPWHYELHPAAIDNGCPPRYADPTQDSRM